MLDKSIRAQAFWQEMKFKSQKAMISRKDAKSIAKKTFAYSLRLCPDASGCAFNFLFLVPACPG